MSDTAASNPPPEETQNEQQSGGEAKPRSGSLGIAGATAALMASNRLKEKLYDYTVTIDPESTDLPVEVVETEEYFYVALEIPGLTSVKDIKFELGMLQFGYEVTLSSEVRSAVDAPPVGAGPISKRILGNINWKATVKGVFEGRPECNYKYGVWKMRLRKRSHKEEAVDLVDF